MQERSWFEAYIGTSMHHFVEKIETGPVRKMKRIARNSWSIQLHSNRISLPFSPQSVGWFSLSGCTSYGTLTMLGCSLDLQLSNGELWRLKPPNQTTTSTTHTDLIESGYFLGYPNSQVIDYLLRNNMDLISELAEHLIVGALETHGSIERLNLRGH